MSVSIPAEPTSPESAASGAILKWSRECPAWQRDALRRLCVKDRLDEADVGELVEMCKNEGVGGVSLEARHLRDPGGARAAVTLGAVHSVDHVNALATGERLTFGDVGLTIVYGDNGSGKSGYARILKQACRARVSKGDTVHNNVYAARPGIPTAIIDFSVDGQGRSAIWTRDRPTDPSLSAVSIFDSRTASVHVEQSNDLAYTPRPLKLLAALARVCGEVKTRLASELGALHQQTPATLRKPPCRPSTAVGILLAELSGSTKADVVRELARLTPADTARLAGLKADLADDPAQARRQLQQRALRVERIVAYLDGLERASADDAVETLVQSVRRLAAACDAARVVSNGMFAEDPLQEIGSEVWRVLWSAARAYSESAVYVDRAFPVTTRDARCVLCHQSLGDDARQRLERFEAFVIGEVSRLEASAREAYTLTIAALDAALLSRHERREVVACVRDELPDEALRQQLRQRLAIHVRRLRQMRRCHRDAADVR